MQKWNRRWLILRRSDGGRSARLEKYESESAAGFQASAHCAVYDLADATVQLPRDKPATIYILLNDLSSVHIATDFGQLVLSTFSRSCAASTPTFMITEVKLDQQ